MEGRILRLTTVGGCGPIEQPLIRARLTMSISMTMSECERMELLLIPGRRTMSIPTPAPMHLASMPRTPRSQQIAEIDQMPR
jgi:hypothetical protein